VTEHQVERFCGIRIRKKLRQNPMQQIDRAARSALSCVLEWQQGGRALRSGERHVAFATRLRFLPVLLRPGHATLIGYTPYRCLVGQSPAEPAVLQRLRVDREPNSPSLFNIIELYSWPDGTQRITRGRGGWVVTLAKLEKPRGKRNRTSKSRVSSAECQPNIYGGRYSEISGGLPSLGKRR
jgi:hypothetical protein